MSSFFSTLSGGLTRFIYAWVMPSAVVVAAFGIFILPYASPGRLTLTTRQASTGEVVLVYVLSVLMLTVLFAYTSTPIYQFLEGYTMPNTLKSPLLRRRHREWYRVRAAVDRYVDGRSDEYPREHTQYPLKRDDLLPTKLGNALRAMEDYGGHIFGLDTLILWNELEGVASDNLRKDGEDARAEVDFFISAFVHLAVLAIACGVVAGISVSAVPACVAVVAICLMPLAYAQAVRNVDDWRSAVQALVHLGRMPLAKSLGLKMPRTLADERDMWEAFTAVVRFGPERNPQNVRLLDRRRVR